MRRSVGPLALVVVLALPCACTHFAERGETLYREHRYVEAAEVFERTEARLTETSEVDCAQYGLYRGLTYLYLGDLGGARRWLGYASAIVQKKPGSLITSERSLLERAWTELDARSQTTSVSRAAVSVADPAPLVQRSRAPGNGQRAVVTE